MREEADEIAMHDGVGEVALVPRVPCAPKAPTVADREEHEATGHAAYRSWCPHCVAARGRRGPHLTSEPGELPEVGFDYGFLGHRRENCLTLLVGKDRRTGSLMCSAVPRKGACAYARAFATGWLLSLGYKRLVMKSDNEHGLLSLLRDVAADAVGVECIPKTSPEGDSSANGLAEGAVREVKAQVRVLRSQLEQRLGERLPEDEPVLAWIPRHAANVLSRFRLQEDGRTAEQRRTGRRWRRPTLEFGETALFYPTGVRDKNESVRMQRGIFVGQHERSGAALMLTPTGVGRGVRLARVVAEDRWDATFVKTCRGLPWETRPRQRELPAPLAGPSENGVGLAPIVQPPAVERTERRREVGPRKRYVTRADVEKHGPTDECLACTQVHLGAAVITSVHTDKCRNRIGLLIEADAGDAKGKKRLRSHAEKLEATTAASAPVARGQDGPQPLAADVAEEPAAELLEEPAAESLEESAVLALPGPARPALPEPRAEKRPTDSREESPSRRLRGIERRGEKREADEGADDSERTLIERHIDDDVAIREGTAAAASSSDGGPQPIADGAGQDLDADLSQLIRQDTARQREAVDVMTVAGAETVDENAVGMTIALNAFACKAKDGEAKLIAENGFVGMKAGLCLNMGAGIADRGRAARELGKKRPELLVGSCLGDAARLLLDRGAAVETEMLSKLARAYKAQLSEGKHFLHEMPEGANNNEDFHELLADKGVQKVVGPRRRWTATVDGTAGAVWKKTLWITSLPSLAADLAQDAAGEARRVEFEVGVAAAPVLPHTVVFRALSSYQRWVQDDLREASALESAVAGPVPDDVGEMNVAMQRWLESETYDAEGVKLDPGLVAAGRAEELAWVRRRGVYAVVPKSECEEHQGKPYTLKWVDKMKGGVCRSRLVVREVKRAKGPEQQLDEEDVFSAMPPVEALKMLVSYAMTDGTDELGRPLAVACWDVSRAHLYGKAVRRVYTTLPEGAERPGFVALLLRTMYGTQDAAKVWGDTWRGTLTENKYEIGTANPSLFRDRFLKGFCHGDDFFCVAADEELNKFGGVLAARFDVRETGRLNLGTDAGEMKILNRILKWRPENGGCIDLVPDPRHVEILLDAAGLRKGKGVDTPRVRRSPELQIEAEGSDELDREAQREYRSAVMRCMYLGQDRPDVSEAVKSLSRHMASPKTAHTEELKRLIRYLLKHPIGFLRYERQPRDIATLTVYTDSDWAGDALRRRSTTGLAILRGSHLLRHASALQTTIGLSSAEAEYYAVTRGASCALGLRAFFADLGVQVAIVMRCDSSAAAAVATRKGLGRLRHLHTRHLWLQDRVERKEIRLEWLPGSLNPADVLTKALARADLVKHCAALGQRWHE